MIVLGINAYHGDASAAIVVDGRLVAAAEEERFTRIKHCAGFPAHAVRYCLDAAGVRIDELVMAAIAEAAQTTSLVVMGHLAAGLRFSSMVPTA